MPLKKKQTCICIILSIYVDKILCIIHKKPLQRGRKYNPSLTGREERSSDIFKVLCTRICPVKAFLSDKNWAINYSAISPFKIYSFVHSFPYSALFIF